MAIVLSRRMQALAEMVTPGSLLADVGCDHGFISIYLVQHGICPRVYAMDIHSGPLQRAKEHVAACGLEMYIDIRRSDGVAALKPGEADCLLCAGMGGRLMQKILTQGREKVSAMRELILQPQSEIADFRRFLREEGFVIEQERMVLEDGKYYPMMRVVPLGKRQERTFYTQQGQVVSERQERLADKFGGLLLHQRDPVLRRYLRERLIKYETILESLSSRTGMQGDTAVREERKKTVLEEIEDMHMALEMYATALSGMEAAGGKRNDYSDGGGDAETVSQGNDL